MVRNSYARAPLNLSWRTGRRERQVVCVARTAATRTSMIASNWKISWGWRRSMAGSPRRHLGTRVRSSHLPGQLHRCTRTPGGLVAAVQDIGDVVDLLGSWGGVPGGGPQI